MKISKDDKNSLTEFLARPGLEQSVGNPMEPGLFLDGQAVIQEWIRTVPVEELIKLCPQGLYSHSPK